MVVKVVNLLEDFNKKQMEVLAKDFPEFGPGDDLRLVSKVVDGASERIQVFEGVCIAKRNRGLHSSFTVRKVSRKESILSQFFVYAPSLISIDVVRKGKVRRAKLYYLCKLFGKSARIKGRVVYANK